MIWERLDGKVFELEPEVKKSDRGLPPLVQLALDRKAVLLTNAKFADVAIGCYRAPSQQQAMRSWLRQWVWPFTFAHDRFRPRDDFVLPHATLAANAGAPIHAVLEQEMEASVSGLFTAIEVQVVHAVELPAVATQRIESLCHLVQRIHERCCPSLAHLTARPPSGSSRHVPPGRDRRAAFHERKQAWDILSKWVFHSVATAASSGFLPPDPVIPSGADGATLHWLSLQLFATYRHMAVHTATDGEHWARIAEELLREASQAALSLSEYRQSLIGQWQTRLAAGVALNDPVLWMSCRDHPTDPQSVQIVWRPGGAGGSAASGGEAEQHTIELWRSHYEDLRRVYLAGSHAPSLLLCRLFAMTTRYDALSEDKSANQAAIPSRAMATLRHALGVQCECYASPLNRCSDVGIFCSAWFDTDQFFGAVGPFQSFHPTSGSFEANPPFDKASVIACFQHISKLFRGADAAMSFVVVIPAMDHTADLAKAVATCSDHLVRPPVEAPRGRHAYLMGLQHRRTAGGELHWVPDKPSHIYFLQNQMGSLQWPVTDGLVQQLLSDFDVMAAREPMPAGSSALDPRWAAVPHHGELLATAATPAAAQGQLRDLGERLSEGSSADRSGSSLDLEELLNLGLQDVSS